MICGSREFVGRIPPDLPRIEVSGIPVPYVEWVQPQVDAVTKKVNRALHSLNFFRHLTTFELRKRLVSALALSHLDYCSTVYSNISGDLKLQLQK